MTIHNPQGNKGQRFNSLRSMMADVQANCVPIQGTDGEVRSDLVDAVARSLEMLPPELGWWVSLNNKNWAVYFLRDLPAITVGKTGGGNTVRLATKEERQEAYEIRAEVQEGIRHDRKVHTVKDASHLPTPVRNFMNRPQLSEEEIQIMSYAKKLTMPERGEVYFVKDKPNLVIAKFVQRTQVIDGHVCVVDGGQYAYRVANDDEKLELLAAIGACYIDGNMTSVQHLGEEGVPHVVRMMADQGMTAFAALPPADPEAKTIQATEV